MGAAAARVFVAIRFEFDFSPARAERLPKGKCRGRNGILKDTAHSSVDESVAFENLKQYASSLQQDPASTTASSADAADDG